MVLQANRSIRIFANGNGRITVSLAGRTKSMCSIDADRLIELDPHDYVGPYCMTVTLDGEQAVFEDIHFGDVCLLGGQLNMQLKLREPNEPTQSYVG